MLNLARTNCNRIWLVSVWQYQPLSSPPVHAPLWQCDTVVDGVFGRVRWYHCPIDDVALAIWRDTPHRRFGASTTPTERRKSTRSLTHCYLLIANRVSSSRRFSDNLRANKCMCSHIYIYTYNTHIKSHPCIAKTMSAMTTSRLKQPETYSIPPIGCRNCLMHNYLNVLKTTGSDRHKKQIVVFFVDCTAGFNGKTNTFERRDTWNVAQETTVSFS